MYHGMVTTVLITCQIISLYISHNLSFSGDMNKEHVGWTRRLRLTQTS